MGISAVIICFNEQDRIGSCLQSVAWCDEIVVVDSFSSDGTLNICYRYTDRIIQRQWAGYGEQTAFAVAQARQPWVLLLEADERVTPELQEEIRNSLVKDGERTAGFALPRLVTYLGRKWRRGGWYPDYKIKLFQRRLAFFRGTEPHPKVLVHGQVRRLQNPLRHHTYRHITDHLDRINRYTTIASQVKNRQGQRWRRIPAILRPAGRFLRFYVWKGGFLEGFPGFFVAATAAYYVFLKYAKLWEIELREQAETNSQQIHGESSQPAEFEKH